MNPFLKQVAADVLQKHTGHLDEIAVVLPSRRATLYFKKHLAGLLEKPMFSPQVFALQDFINKFSGLDIPDELQLVFSLFNIYRKYNPHENFEGFYPWGTLLLKDFDDADRNLAKTSLLFKNLHEVKELESEGFGTEGFEVKKAREFWEAMNQEKGGDLSRKFLKIWEVMDKIHHEFSNGLLAANKAYEGLAYRQLADKIASPEFRLPYSQVIFAGFNALSVSEESIIKTLYRNGSAEVYFDADEFFLKDKNHEAGSYLRKFISSWPVNKLNWQHNYLLGTGKEVEFIGAPLHAGQVKAMAHELQLLLESGANPSDIAIVLPDEDLLLPVLNILPPQLEEVNVTMGYPLSGTSIYRLFDSIIYIIHNVQPENNGFYYKDLEKVFNQPLLHHLYGEEIRQVITFLKESQRIFISARQLVSLSSNAFIQQLFGEEIHAVNLLKLFIHLAAETQKITSGSNPIENEFAACIHAICNKLQNEIEEANQEIGFSTFRKIFLEYARGQKIPFTGEPIGGLQVMGMLETRTLDFRHLLILSVNEGILPSDGASNSFIPYDLRKAFNLPTRDEQSALYAYHFYRILQRASSIRLFYNTEAGHLSSGEKSRYLLQIEHLLAPGNPQMKLKHKIYSTGFSVTLPHPITISKTPEITRELKNLMQEGISPTVISGFAICPLKFYFQRIEKIREEDEDKPEIIEAGIFGSLFHDAMQKLYEPFIGSEVGAKEIDGLEGKIDAALREACTGNQLNYEELIEGRNFFAMETIRILIRKTLQLDKESPFTIEFLEEEQYHTLPLPKHGIEVKLKGFIDRVDSQKGHTRIIDYKTGSVKKTDFVLSDALADITHENKEAFQLMFYSYLANKSKGYTNISPVLLPLKEINNGYKKLKLIQENERKAPEVMLDEEALGQFEGKLIELFNYMLDESIPIHQTEDEKNCTWCSYKRICGKE